MVSVAPNDVLTPCMTLFWKSQDKSSTLVLITMHNWGNIVQMSGQNLSILHIICQKFAKINIGINYQIEPPKMANIYQNRPKHAQIGPNCPSSIKNQSILLKIGWNFWNKLANIGQHLKNKKIIKIAPQYSQNWPIFPKISQNWPKFSQYCLNLPKSDKMPQNLVSYD